jgi:hypothetical protein
MGSEVMLPWWERDGESGSVEPSKADGAAGIDGTEGAVETEETDGTVGAAPDEPDIIFKGSKNRLGSICGRNLEE